MGGDFTKTKIFLAIFAVFALLASLNCSKDCNVCGVFILQSDINDPALEKYWKVIGYSEEAIRRMKESSDVILTVEKSGSKYSIEISGTKCGNIKFSFEPGKQFDQDLCDGRKIKTTAVVNEEGRKIKFTQLYGDVEATGTWEYNGKNLIIKLKAKETTAELLLTEKGKSKENIDPTKQILQQRSKSKDKDSKNSTKANIALLPISVEV